MRRIIILLLSAFILVSPVTASSSLEGQIQAVTGIVRPQSAALTALAQTRSAEVVSVLGHNIGSRLPDWYWGEVIAASSGYSDPGGAAVDGWRNSAPHWAVLSDPFYQQIGCGATYVEPRWYFVCIVGTQVQPKSVPAPAPVKVVPVPGPTLDGVPNTAMSWYVLIPRKVR